MSNKIDTIDLDKVMRRVKAGESPLKIADELQVHRGALYRRLRKIGDRTGIRSDKTAKTTRANCAERDNP